MIAMVFGIRNLIFQTGTCQAAGGNSPAEHVLSHYLIGACSNMAVLLWPYDRLCILWKVLAVDAGKLVHRRFPVFRRLPPASYGLYKFA